MMSLLSRYLSVMLVKRFVSLTLIVMVLGGLMEFLDDKNRILRDSEGSIFLIAQYMLYSAPYIFSRLSAMIALVASVATMVGLLRYRELIAVSAAGVSQWRLMIAILPGAVLIAGFQFMIDNGGLSRSAYELRDLAIGDYAPSALGRSADIWLQEGNDILSLRQAHRRSGELGPVNIFQLDDNGLLTGHVTAQKAILEGTQILLFDAIQTSTDPSMPTETSDFSYRLSVDGAVLSSLFLNVSEMTWFDLGRILENPNTGNRPFFVFQLWYNKKLSGPIATLAIIMLAIPLVQGFSRVSNYFAMMFLSLALGFIYVVIDAIVVSFGEAGLVTSMVAAWTMPLILMTLVATAVFHQELIKRPGENARA